MRVRPGKAVAGYDSASAMLRVLARALIGKSSPMLGNGFPSWAEPPVNALLKGIDRLPRRSRELITTRGGTAEALPLEQVPDVDTEAIAQWVVDRYPRRRWPAVLIGSSNGALTHLAAASGVPWLPQTLLIPVRRRPIDPDDARADLDVMAPAVSRLLDANPRVAVHQMRDPIQDRLPIERMSYLRIKWLSLPTAYRRFLDEQLAEHAPVLVSDCRTRWPTTQVRDRHVFQFGGVGPQSVDELFEGGPRVRTFLTAYGSSRHKWDPPEPDGERAEAEWGLRPELLDDIHRHPGHEVLRLGYDDPQDASGPVADLYRCWLRERGMPDDRLVVEQFLYVEPRLTLLTGRVPYWTLFGVETSLRRLTEWLTSSQPFQDIRMTLFSHGTLSPGMATGADWAGVLSRAPAGGWLGADPTVYPLDLRTVVGFHHDFARLPERVPEPPPLTLDSALDHLRSSSGVAVDHSVRT